MRTLPINPAMSYVATSLITVGLFVSSTTLAMPLQTSVSTTSKPVTKTALNPKPDASGSRKSSVLVRNTTAKTEPASTGTKATPQKVQAKKAVSRCWKRLMDMVREIRHAQNTKNN